MRLLEYRGCVARRNGIIVPYVIVFIFLWDIKGGRPEKYVAIGREGYDAGFVIHAKRNE